jgi:hypothetical protein
MKQDLKPHDLQKDVSLLTGLLRMKGLKFVLDNDNHHLGGGWARYTSPTLPTFLVSSSQHSLIRADKRGKKERFVILTRPPV